MTVTTDLTLPLPAERFLPHRQPMRFIDELVEAGEGTGVAVATVTAENPLAEADGRLPEVGMVEMVAQAFAALRGFEDCRRGEPVKRGFLVGIRSFRLHGAAQVGDRLEIRMRTLAELEGMALVEGEVRRGEQVLATGTVKLWVSAEVAAEEE